MYAIPTAKRRSNLGGGEVCIQTPCACDHVTTNGATVVMKKDLDYTFIVPMVHNYFALEFNAKIPQANLLGVCFQMTGYGADGNGLPSEANY